MKNSEASALLTLAAAFDRRTVGKADAQAWALALGDIRLDDAREAVVAHFSESSEWLTPAHVRKLVRQIRAARIGDTSSLNPPPELADEPMREIAWKRELRNNLADGMGRDEAVEAADRSQGITAPRASITVGEDVVTEAIEATAAALRRGVGPSEEVRKQLKEVLG